MPLHLAADTDFMPILVRQNDHDAEHNHTKLVTVYERLLEGVAETVTMTNPTGIRLRSPSMTGSRHRRSALLRGLVFASAIAGMPVAVLLARRRFLRRAAEVPGAERASRGEE